MGCFIGFGGFFTYWVTRQQQTASNEQIAIPTSSSRIKMEMECCCIIDFAGFLIYWVTRQQQTALDEQIAIPTSSSRIKMEMEDCCFLAFAVVKNFSSDFCNHSDYTVAGRGFLTGELVY